MACRKNKQLLWFLTKLDTIIFRWTINFKLSFWHIRNTNKSSLRLQLFIWWNLYGMQQENIWLVEKKHKQLLWFLGNAYGQPNNGKYFSSNYILQDNLSRRFQCYCHLSYCLSNLNMFCICARSISRTRVISSWNILSSHISDE